MIRRVFVALVVLHGLIHLLGTVKAFGWAALPHLTQPVSRAMGVVWLAAALAMFATAALIVLAPRTWWMVAVVAVALSQLAIVASWRDAWAGTLANVVILMGATYGFLARGPFSLHAAYERAVAALPAAPTSAVVTEADLAPLPPPVARYVRAAGAVGAPRVTGLHATWTGRIRASATSPWMPFAAEQHNTFDPPRRLFMMDARMKGLPVAVLHRFDERGATMRVELLAAIPIVDAAGAEMTRAETVTVFNDLCLYAPGALVSPAIAWEPIDDRTARGRFTLGANTVTAELRFDEANQLVDFVSDDRLAASSDGRTFTRRRWATPVGRYARVGPARVATHGEGRWDAPGGAFTYVEADLTSLRYPA